MLLNGRHPCRATPGIPESSGSLRLLVVSALVCLAFPLGEASADGVRSSSNGSAAPVIEGQEFRRLMEAGVLNNGLGRHRAAEEAIRSAVGRSRSSMALPLNAKHTPPRLEARQPSS